MSEVSVEARVDLVSDGDLQELDEAAIAARLADCDTALLREVRALDGAIRIGGTEIVDELFSAVQRLCFESAAALLADGAVVEYRYSAILDEPGRRGRRHRLLDGDLLEPL
ncbi:MAG: hypothetical protein E6J90_48115 [Deltaproteobacteria bacterium]|nr:MAG: hypothetical protein E6J90_48115 [Deltaproteobacteria bacterium]TMQ20232.1 MAG: hypothetical protein E6J91_04300 [Deltaproteobacteria bacterium]